jgi:tetratricopeptide (TPR) repeat protein
LGPTCRAVQRKWFRVTWSCALFLALSSLPSNAQSPSLEVPPSTTVENSTISVRALQIPRKAQDAFRHGTELLAANQAAASIPEFQRALRIFPEFYEAQYKIGLASVNLRRYQDAQAAFEASIELSKGRHPPSQFGLAVALCAQKQYSEAEEAVRAGLDQVPADAAGNFTLAWILFSAGKLAEAEKSARQAVLSNSNLASAYLLLAQIHLRRSDLPAVVSALDAYLRLDPVGPHNVQARALRTEAQQLLAKQPGTAPVLAETPAKNREP